MRLFTHWPRPIARFSDCRPLAIWLCLSAMLLLSALDAGAGGQEAAGTIVALRGQVSIVRAGSELSPQSKDPVLEGDTIRTGADGRVQVMFQDNTLISLGSNTEAAVKEYRWQPDQQEAAMRTTVKEGVLRVMGGAITKMAPQNFTTETPTATIGIRGSMYLVKSSPTDTDAVFLGGRGIFVTNAQGRVEINTPGFGTHVEQGQRPQPARIMGGDEIKALEGAITATFCRPADSGQRQGKIDDEDKGDKTTPAACATGTTAASATALGSDDEVHSQPKTGTTSRRSLAPSPYLTDPATITTPITDIEQTAGQQTLTESVADTAPPPATPSVGMTGLSLSSYLGANSGELFTGPSTASNDDGQVEGQVAAPNGAYDLAFRLASPLVGASFSTRLGSGFPRLRTLLGTDYSLTGTKLVSSSLGDFAYLMVDATFAAAGQAYDYLELTSLGTPAASLPSSGLSRYNGSLLSVAKNSLGTQFKGDWQTVDLVVNWRNRKVFGVVSGTPGATVMLSHAYFVGEVAGGAITNVKVVGSANDPLSASISALDSQAIGAAFYGFLGQGVAGRATLDFYDLNSAMGAAQSSAQVVLAGLRTALPGTLIPTTATTPAHFTGFAVGIAEDIANIDQNRRLYTSQPGDFSIDIDRAAGTVTGGRLKVGDSSDATLGLDMGIGAGKTAYLDDKVLLAAIDPSNAVSSGGLNGPLKPKGNYLVTAEPQLQKADYATWGYWEVAYQDPQTKANYHLHDPYGMWVAGELTPADQVQGKINNGIVASYTGAAYGTLVDSSQAKQVTPLPAGTLNLHVDFGKTTVADAVTGSLNFPADAAVGFGGRTLTIGSTANTLNNSGFAAMITDAGVLASQVNGAFYGPLAKSVAGNFRADFASQRYQGIFLGNR